MYIINKETKIKYHNITYRNWYGLTKMNKKGVIKLYWIPECVQIRILRERMENKFIEYLCHKITLENSQKIWMHRTEILGGGPNSTSCNES